MSIDYSITKGYIYKITSPNGKVYIGQTVRLSKRKSHYKTGDFKQQTKLWNNCKKYNWNPLDTFEVIEECLCGDQKQILNEREIYWISFYNSFINGLNCNEGGFGNLGYSHSKETLEKMSKAHLGVKHPEWRNKQKSEYTTGRKHTEKSKYLMSVVKKERMTQELKDKISLAQKGRSAPWAIGNKGGSKKIKCINNDTVYESIKHASQELPISVTSILHILKGRRQEINGYCFEYYEEEF